MNSIKKSAYNNLPSYAMEEIQGADLSVGNLVKVPSKLVKDDLPEDKVMIFEITDEGNSKQGMKLLWLNLVEG